jgi:H/ACA ribonucleoprotein complex subunit 1
MIPYFNAPVFKENKQQIGKIEEVFGPINEVVRLSTVFDAF